MDRRTPDGFTALNGNSEFKFNESISFVVHCKNQKELDYYWKKLTSGGGKEVACGWLKDKFGVAWQIVPEGLVDLISDQEHPEKAASAMKAMMSMVKFDIQALKDAYNAGAALDRRGAIDTALHSLPLRSVA